LDKLAAFLYAAAFGESFGGYGAKGLTVGILDFGVAGSMNNVWGLSFHHVFQERIFLYHN
jgi:hypothetical protein